MAVAGALPPFGNEVILPPGHLLRQHPEEHPSQLPRQQRLPGRIQTAVCIEMHQDASSVTVQHRECLFSWSLACVQDLKQRTPHEPRSPHPEPVRPRQLCPLLQHRHELPIHRHFDQNLQSFNEISCRFIDNAAGAWVAGAKPATLAASEAACPA